MTAKLKPAELVIWLDAWVDDSWAAIEEDGEPEGTVVSSLGFVVKETEDYITLAAMDVPADNMTNARAHIPKRCILVRRRVRLPRIPARFLSPRA